MKNEFNKLVTDTKTVDVKLKDEITTNYPKFMNTSKEKEFLTTHLNGGMITLYKTLLYQWEDN